mgnify:CR=1 FL=1
MYSRPTGNCGTGDGGNGRGICNGLWLRVIGS